MATKSRSERKTAQYTKEHTKDVHAALTSTITTSDMIQEVQTVLDELARHLTAGEGDAIAEMWQVPALVVGDDVAEVAETADQVAQFFSGAKEQYNEKGITDTRAEILTLKWLTSQMVLVAVRWPYLDRNGRENGDESSTYLLRRDADGVLKVQVAIMQGSSEGHR